MDAYSTYLNKLEGQKKRLEQKRQTISNELKKAKNVLREIYNLNIQGWPIIDEDYRGLVATSTIYGYLKTHRCLELFGPGGAYDTFVKDKYANRIVNSVEEVSKKLSIVIANQESLKKSIDSINDSLGNIKREIEYNGKQLDDIRNNSSIAAIASTQSAAAQSYVASVAYLRNS